MDSEITSTSLDHSEYYLLIQLPYGSTNQRRRANPAGLDNSTDSVFDMFNKIVTSGNAANSVQSLQLARFGSYADDSHEGHRHRPLDFYPVLINPLPTSKNLSCMHRSVK
jgi:hypothetical protein